MYYERFSIQNIWVLGLRVDDLRFRGSRVSGLGYG